MNKKFFVVFYLAFIFFTVLLEPLNCVYSEENVSNQDSSVPQTDSQTQSVPGGENGNTSSSDASKTQTENKPKLSTKKSKKKENKVKNETEDETKNEIKNENEVKDTPQEEKTEDLKNQKSFEPDIKSNISLPDISDDEILSKLDNNKENNIIKYPSGEKLIKGIIAWVLMISGILLIIWVILLNRKVSDEKPIKLKKKKRIYYKSSQRK